MKFALKIGKYTLRVAGRFTKEIEVEGTYTLCNNGQHVVYLDYDIMEKKAIDLEIRNLQEMFLLGKFYIFQSSQGNHHAICLDKVDAETYERIICASNCDPSFKRFNRFNRMASRVLRTSPKNGNEIKFLHTIDSHSCRRRSNAHRKLLNSRYSLNIKKDDRFDKYEDLFICRYTTVI